MITVDEVIYLLSHHFVEEFYIPEEYLYYSNVEYYITTNNWVVVRSEVRGWAMLRRRMIYQD